MLAAAVLALQSSPLRAQVIWFAQPAQGEKGSGGGVTYINQALPIGNGRIGALVCGGTDQELLRLNEDSLWTGDLNPSGNYGTMGAYQALGDMKITLAGQGSITDYRRELDLGSATVLVTYQADGVAYHRQYFASRPAGLIIGRFTADKPGGYTGAIELDDSHGGNVVAAGNRITMTGTLPNGLIYEGQLMLLRQGGTMNTVNGRIEFKGCDALTLMFAAGTNYAMRADSGYRGGAPGMMVGRTLDNVMRFSYGTLLIRHQADYLHFYNRVALDLGPSTPAQRALPTDQRRILAAKQPDPELEAILFDYGRYLLISCSRPGGLPANLQGMWNDSNDPPWSSDYHTNINVEMCYWPAEVVNLPECATPLLDLVSSQLPSWRDATRASSDLKTPSGDLSRRGWAIRTSHNIFGGMGWNWDKTANAWYALHFWEHYAFSGDKVYLANVAYPLMKEVCQFWEDHLKALPDGRLVVPDGWSPEHGPHEDGVTYNQEIVWDLFNNYAQASNILGVDKEYRDKIASMRDKLAAPRVGSWGQLLEWLAEKKNDGVLDTPNDHHRHTSHLFAVYPGRQITLQGAPALAAAAHVSLVARGNTGDVREWSYAWRAALYARLGDAEAAHSQLMHFFGATTPNLFGYHPPMQIDGDFGITAAIAEMLVQSQDGAIDLLPALPAEWPNGSVYGLRARGGFVVNVIWKKGALDSAMISSDMGGAVPVRYRGKTVTVTLAPKAAQTLSTEFSQ